MTAAPKGEKKPIPSKRVQVAFVDIGRAPQTRHQALIEWYDRRCAQMDTLSPTERAELDARAAEITQAAQGAAHAAD